MHNMMHYALRVTYLNFVQGTQRKYITTHVKYKEGNSHGQPNLRGFYIWERMGRVES